jgi:elongation factor G
MQVDSPDKIRNLALAGHNASGKTTLVSALLHTTGVVNRMLRIEDKNTLTDFDHEEMERGISIGVAPCHVPWRGYKVNLLDCPGYGIFFTETRAGMRAADAVLMCVNSVAGVEVNTEKVWETAVETGQPVLFYLAKMDRERADFDRAIEALRGRFGREVAAVHVPIGIEHGFSGVVDLVTGKAYRYTRDGNGKADAADVPADLTDRVAELRNQLMEMVAETDDALLERFFEEGTLDDESLRRGLRSAIARRRLFPVFAGCGLHNIGSSALLDAVVDYAPSPVDAATVAATGIGDNKVELPVDTGAPVTAVVFKTFNDPFAGKISILRVASGTLKSDSTVANTTRDEQERLGTLMAMQGKQGTPVAHLVAGDIGGVAKLKNTHSGDTLGDKERPLRLPWIPVPQPAIAFAIEPKSKGDEDKIGDALHRLLEEDPALQATRDPQTGEHLLAGTGQLHVEIAVAKLKSRYKVEVILHPPKVPYRETIKRRAEGHGRHKKQTGGRGQFADCKIIVEPLQRGEDYEFKDEIFGGAIPHNFRPAVDKGIQEARHRGYLAGYPMGDFRVRLIDGSYHDVDSSEMAFKIAGSLAYKDAMEKAGPTILEPIMKVEITAGEEYMGDIMGDLSQRRGRPQGMESRSGTSIIKAAVPMAEMLNYAPALRSMTQGRASFHMEFSHYEEVPRPLQEKIVHEAKKRKEEEAEAS